MEAIQSPLSLQSALGHTTLCLLNRPGHHLLQKGLHGNGKSFGYAETVTYEGLHLLTRRRGRREERRGGEEGGGRRGGEGRREGGGEEGRREEGRRGGGRRGGGRRGGWEEGRMGGGEDGRRGGWEEGRMGGGEDGRRTLQGNITRTLKEHDRER